MNNSTRDMIRLALDNDPTVSAGQQAAILRCCKQRDVNGKRRLGTARQAASILSCHPKTVYRYAKRGLLQPIHYSARKVRFDLLEVEDFAASGMTLEDAADDA